MAVTTVADPATRFAPHPGHSGEMTSRHQRPSADSAATAFWDNRYAERDQIWSGRPNAALVGIVSDLEPGSVLDLGCGEGGDSVWLAGRGWTVAAVDISSTAIARGQRAAMAAGIPPERISWTVGDLTSWEPADSYDLVSACFLHSHAVAFPRTEVLRRAAASVTPEGHLLIVGHAEPPPWASDHEHFHAALLSPDEEVAQLDLPRQHWSTVVAEVRFREATGPDGQSANLGDSVVLLRRER